MQRPKFSRHVSPDALAPSVRSVAPSLAFASRPPWPPSAPATPYMIGIERTGNTGASWNVFQNGSALALTAGNNVGVSLTNGPVSVGAYIDGTLAANLTAGEFIIVSGTLSTGDRQKLEGYLAWKWGLEANLPSGHPYKLLPPTV